MEITDSRAGAFVDPDLAARIADAPLDDADALARALDAAAERGMLAELLHKVALARRA